MSIPKITETNIRLNSNETSFTRGKKYYDRNAVISITQRGNILQSEVQGSQIKPYCVNLSFDKGGFTSAICNCAYDWDGWCKHIVATLLVCIKEPDKIEQRLTLEKLLDKLNLVQTQTLIQNLVAENPQLIEAIDRHVNIMIASTPAKTPTKSTRKTTIDPTPFRSQVRHILREALRYLEDGYEDDPITEEIANLIETAQNLTEQGNPHNALVILSAITESCIENWGDIDEYGADNEEIVTLLNETWTEAILTAELTPEEKTDLQVNLETWQDEWNTDFNMSLEALRQDWNYPPLQEILQGKGNQIEKGIWETEKRPDYADNLALIRLKILARENRYEEYLYLAKAEKQIAQYLTMLTHLDRIDEAMAEAKILMQVMEEAFTLAKNLREKEALPQALEIAEIGLNFPGNCQYNLADWTSDLAAGLENYQLALKARIIAFLAHPSFQDYRKVEELAKENWPTIKLNLLYNLRNSKHWDIHNEKVNIFLHEGLIDDAISTVTNLSSYYSQTIQKVMTAAIIDRPQWVIENAIPRAESIMDAGKAEYYQLAVDWLKNVRSAYIQIGQHSEWSQYRAKLIQKHGRKHKLMGLIKPNSLE